MPNISTATNVIGLNSIITVSVVVCGGMLGFEEFYRKDWWNLVKSWQDETGCYKSNTPSVYGTLR
jgi:hypothetical protein